MHQILCFLCFLIPVLESRLTVTEQEWEQLTPEQVSENADLVSEITSQDPKCEWIKINKKKFKVFIVNEKGEPVADDIVEIRSSDSGDTEIGYNPKNLKDGLPYNLTIYPRLNCFDQDDPELVQEILEKIIDPPSEENFPGRFVDFNERESQYHQDQFLDKVIFKDKVRNGFFVEAGADDFLSGSNTLLLEEKYNWTGLLVEPIPFRYKLGLTSKRNCWSAPACLSTTTRPNLFNLTSAIDGGMAGIIPPEMDIEPDPEFDMQLQCFPLYSMLLALGNPTVNLLSLDIEGAEFEIFKTIPWDDVDIEVILSELIHAGETFPGTRMEIINFLESKHYKYIGNLFDDVFVRKDLLQDKYSINYEEAKILFPLFSQEKHQERQNILDTFVVEWGDERDPVNGTCNLRKYLDKVIKAISESIG